MTETGSRLALVDTSEAGVFFVTGEDFAAIDVAAGKAGLLARRIDLHRCQDKAELLRRIAKALELPDTFGHNWDALSDSLRDLGWLPAPGYVLLFGHAVELRDAAEEDFDTLLDILAETAIDWVGQDIPFWAFFAMPESAFERPDA